jgi:type IV pilus assembly protein PilP
MKKYLILICNLVCLIGFLTGLLGCDQAANEPATPKIVRKKIRNAPDTKTGTPQRKPASASRPAPKAEPPGSGKQVSEKPVMAQKSAPPAMTPQEKKAPQLALKPKSDISQIKTPTQIQPDRKTASGRPAEPGAEQTIVASASLKNLPIYDPKGKINPFEPLFTGKQTAGLTKLKRKRRVPRTELEKIDLSQLKLVGIILASNGNKALVEESNGKGYVIKKGTYIGTNTGKVVQIDNNKVIVAEEFEDYRGNVVLKNTEIKLPKPPGEF